MSCLNTRSTLRPGNVESPIGVLIGLSTEDRIDDAAGVTCGPNVGATQLAPLRDAQPGLFKHVSQVHRTTRAARHGRR
jgi:hypothetical protein